MLSLSPPRMKMYDGVLCFDENNDNDHLYDVRTEADLVVDECDL